jgi:3-hydroxyisobutyrate dehydrogenase-like beta-hydroxyacid dehydrogenase
MRLLIFGFGYSALHIARRRQRAGTELTATVRTRAKAEDLARLGVTARAFWGADIDTALAADIRSSDAILSSIPPGKGGEPVLSSFVDAISGAPKLRWLGYLSTVGVYGDHAGAWVDEATPTD